jgi:hypothetical protein
MFFSLLKWALISLTLIFLVHHLYIFLLNTLTVPKIKDLVNKPNQQYKDIFKTMNQDTKESTKNDPMADELTSFLSDLKKTTTSTIKKETIGDINSFPTTNDMSYSFY